MLKKSLFIIAFFLIIISTNSFAQELVYQPINPSFIGGNTFNASWLMANATAINNFSDKSSSSMYSEMDPFADFEQSFKRQILSQLSSQLVKNIFGEDLLTEGKYELGDFMVEITPGNGGLNIQIFDNKNGSETTIFVPNM